MRSKRGFTLLIAPISNSERNGVDLQPKKTEEAELGGDPADRRAGASTAGRHSSGQGMVLDFIVDFMTTPLLVLLEGLAGDHTAAIGAISSRPRSH